MMILCGMLPVVITVFSMRNEMTVLPVSNQLLILMKEYFMCINSETLSASFLLFTSKFSSACSIL